ncbi:hypothetical protein SISSUDRAFT_1133555 [Sistotremastrum suecicum HHB10207 ss-3]|uniref:F-box domain-containing protein n=1 Tax=Sistotremastrum suecicum HHB10207 ss-3 TaxID=1314776 RepID=A0A165WZ46_9AGAM|nr:hypothetical protein SISSUDRAFT_1133555 [Sistotremastrum suecicum HHB10207 ss-3]
MFIPPELIREIAESIRISDRESLRRKTWEQWHEESLTLIALSSVSRIWRDESLPVLWSEIFVYSSEYAELDRLEAQVAKLLSVLTTSQSETPYAVHLKRLSVHLALKSASGWPSQILTHHLEELISISSRLRYLRVWFNADWITLSPRLSSLIFPDLQILSLNLLPSNTRRPQLMGEFLTNHPGLEDVYLALGSEFQGHTLQQSNPLPNIRNFVGTLSEMRIFSSESRLTAVEVGISHRRGITHTSIQQRFVHELSLLDNPLPHVTTLCINTPNIPFNRVTLTALARSFPSLEILTGFQANIEYLEFLATDVESLSWCLPRLTTLTMHLETIGSEQANTPTVAPEDINAASVRLLKRLFPAISRARIVIRPKTRTDRI